LPVQNIKGTITDKSIKTILVGASIELKGAISKTAIADASDNFILEKIPVGRHALRITYIGYKPITLNNILVESG